MSWSSEKLGALISESRIPANNPNPNRRIRVKLNVLGVEKRPFENEVAGATKQFQRKAGQFIYGKQNFHKGAFGIIPDELDGFETSADIPSFDVREDCLPEWIFYYFKVGNRYLEMVKYARGVGSKRIHPEQIADIDIPLPSIKEQRKLIDRFKKIEESSHNISNEFENQENLLTQLRQSFLREAMQGKMVKQDPKDGHAKDLLEKIKAEKAKSGRKEKELPPIKPEEIPFEIPENWVWCRLGEIAYIASGSTPKQDAFVASGVPYFKMYNLKNQKIDFYHKPQYIKREIHEGQLKRSRAFPGDVLMNIVGPPLGKLAIIPEEFPECNFNQAAVLIRPFVKGINQWIFWYLNEMSEINSIVTKGVAGQDNISVTQSNNIRVPLPTIAELNRIVKRLEELMKFCDELQISIQASREQNELLLQQVLKEALIN